MGRDAESGKTAVPGAPPHRIRSRMPAPRLPRAALLPVALLLLAAACDAAAGTAGRAAAAGAASSAAREPSAPAIRPAGLDSTLLAAALARGAELPRLRAVLVSRRGTLLAERYYDPRLGPATPVNVKSVSKSVLSALVGIAIAEGRLSLQQPIADFFPEHADLFAAEPRKRQITVAQLLAMTSGLESTSFGGYGEWVSSRNWVRAALARPLVAEPGERMIYSTGSSHLLSAVLTRATGQSTWAYAREKLAAPLEVAIPRWTTDPQGIYFGGNEMRLSPRALQRFGELYLGGGEWQGRRVLPAGWVEASWQPRGRSEWSGHAYGYGWWSRESAGFPVHFAWGYGGQYVFVVPALQMVAVFVSEADTPRERGHLGALHALLDDYLVPAALEGAPPLRSAR